MAQFLAGKTIIKILCVNFGFHIVHQKGSHIKLQKKIIDRTITTIVPNHTEVAIGTLYGILKLAEVDKKEFFVYSQNK